MKKQNEAYSGHQMTDESVEAFLIHEAERGSSSNMLRRFRFTARLVFDYLPEDKLLTGERLSQWRESLEGSGLAPVTVQNHVKYINRYLDYAGCSEIRFNRGKAKNIAGRTFGYLTAIEPTDARDRRDVVWRCRCKCGKMVELSATRLLRGNDLSCGCLCKEHFRRANKYIDSTSLRQSLNEQVKSSRSRSGYTGVFQKGEKWLAHITYKGKHYSLGCYAKLEDAVKARARAKQLVREDAMQLLKLYEEIHKSDPELPRRGASNNTY